MSNVPKPLMREILTKVDKLPELPQVAMRLSQMLDDDNASADKLAEIIRVDPSFTSQVLKLCNSAAYGFSRRISTVKEAVAILGFKVLKSMVYTIITKIALDRPVSGYGLDKGELWRNAVTCAVYAKHIARQEGYNDPELAFTGALLRDIGKIILGEYVGANYAQIENIVKTENIDFRDAEERVLGVNHTVIGGKVAERWNLPTTLIEVIRHHHKPSSMPPSFDQNMSKLVSVVHLADVFAMMIGQGVGSDGMMYSIDFEGLKKAGINTDETRLEIMMGQLIDQGPNIKSLLDSFSSN